VAYFSKNCKFVDEKTISIDEDQNIYAQEIVIASGTRPRIPKICLGDNPKVLTIIGGGYICCELAHFFGALGTRINIVQRDNVLIPSEDEEISKRFTQIISKKYNVKLACEVEFVSKRQLNDYGGYEDDSHVITNANHDTDDVDSMFHVLVKDSSGKSAELLSDQLLIATGRIPNSDTLDLDKTA